MLVGFCCCSKSVYSSAKGDINWEIEIGVPCTSVGESPTMDFCCAHIQMPSQFSSLISDLSPFFAQSLGSVSSPVGHLSLTSPWGSFFYKPGHRKDNSFLLLLHKKKVHTCSYSLCFTGFGIYCLRNLASANHKTKHGEIGKLPEFSLCWSLVFFTLFFFFLWKENRRS